MIEYIDVLGYGIFGGGITHIFTGGSEPTHTNRSVIELAFYFFNADIWGCCVSFYLS